MALHTYIGECCQEWPMAFGYPPGRCGLCQQVPKFKREDDDCRCGECRSEGLSGAQVDNPPFLIPEPLQGALKRLSGALSDPYTNTQEALHAYWEVEDELGMGALPDER